MFSSTHFSGVLPRQSSSYVKQEIIEARKDAMKRREVVPDDILQHIIKLQGLLALSFRD